MFLDGTKYVSLYVFKIILVTILLHFSYFLGLWMLMFYTICGSGHAFGGEVRPGSEQSRKETKTVKEGYKHREPFRKNSMCFTMCFFVDFWRSLGKCVFAFWWPKCSKWELLGDTFPDMLQQRWKTQNSGFVYTKHYFLEI